MENTNKQELDIIKTDVVDVVTKKVNDFVMRGELQLPPDYSVSNAFKSAWLVLQETLDRNKQPVLKTCTRNSIANALLNMAVMGLNVEKKQAYFIAYGTKLLLQKSYFGNVLLAKRADNTIDDIIGQVVYAGDEFEYQIYRGKTFVTKHIQELKNIESGKIIAAYATILRKDGNPDKEYSVIKTMDQIKKAWEKSQVNPVDGNGEIKESSTHGKFTADMVMRTVINATCKPIINSSTDEYLVRAYNETEDAFVTEEVNQEISENANHGGIIDVTPTTMEDEPIVDDSKSQPEHVLESNVGEKKASKAPQQQHPAQEESPDF